MAQSPPFSDVVLDSKRQRSDETVHSQAAKAAITDIAVKLCDGMDSMSVALQLHARVLLVTTLWTEGLPGGPGSKELTNITECQVRNHSRSSQCFGEISTPSLPWSQIYKMRT